MYFSINPIGFATRSPAPNTCATTSTPNVRLPSAVYFTSVQIMLEAGTALQAAWFLLLWIWGWLHLRVSIVSICPNSRRVCQPTKQVLKVFEGCDTHNRSRDTLKIYQTIRGVQSLVPTIPRQDPCQRDLSHANSSLLRSSRRWILSVNI